MDESILLDVGVLAITNMMLEMGEMRFEELAGTFFWERITVDVDEYLRFRDPTFRRHFRLTKTQFEILCQELVEHLEENMEIVRVGRDFRHKVLMVLWILATPDTFRSVALRFNAHPGEVHRYYLKIISALCDLGERYIYWPDAAKRAQISAALEEASGLQGVVGMIDGKHMIMTAPGEEPAACRDRHHNYSIIAMAVCDHKLKIRDLYVGKPGSLHDARVFRRSPLCQSILFDQNFMSEGEYLIGDSAFMLLDGVVVPFINNGHLTPRQVQFNRALSKIRVRIEHTFGRVTNIWRRCRNIHIYNMDYMVDHTCASFVLHNFRLYHGDGYHLVHVRDDHPDLEDEIDFENDENEDEFDFENDGDENDNVEDNIPDPYSLQENGAAVLNQRRLRGEQLRWNLCNSL